MFRNKTDSRNYWNARSLKFANYYENPTRFDLIFRKAIFKRFNRVLELLRKYESPSVLDIGSGPGINSVNLLKHSNVRYVTGIDFAPKMNELANNYAKKYNLFQSCHFIEGDFIKYDWSDQCFDISIALGVFDYIDNPQEFILKIEELSKKALVISWPNGGNLRMFLRKLRYTCPVYPYTEKEVRKYHDNCKLIKDYELFEGSAGWVSVAYL